jgi:hypothetical protein
MNARVSASAAVSAVVALPHGLLDRLFFRSLGVLVVAQSVHVRFCFHGAHAHWACADHGFWKESRTFRALMSAGSGHGRAPCAPPSARRHMTTPTAASTHGLDRSRQRGHHPIAGDHQQGYEGSRENVEKHAVTVLRARFDFLAFCRHCYHCHARFI